MYIIYFIIIIIEHIHVRHNLYIVFYMYLYLMHPFSNLRIYNHAQTNYSIPVAACVLVNQGYSDRGVIQTVP